jgi:Kef-type K+ transport system membrane component KefB
MSGVLLTGLILVLALIGGHLVKLLRIPEVVGYLLIGLLLGPSFSNLLDQESISTMEIFSEIALGLILFSIGAVFEFGNMRKVGKQTLFLALHVTAGTVLIVLVSLLILGIDWPIALLLGVIAVEMSPIATVLVMRELNTEGPLTDVVFNVLAINNVICIALFGIVSFAIRIITGMEGAVLGLDEEIFIFVWQMLGSLALGVLLGYILALWGRRVAEHGEVLILVLGMLLIVVGACHGLMLSSLIATMALGATLINLEKESKHLFEVLGKTDPPLYAIFFVLAGADLDLNTLRTIGIAGIIYTIARIAGKMIAAFVGARRMQYPLVVSRYLGLTLLAHAGVAIGLALQVRSVFPEYSQTVTAVVLASVIINEMLGPILTKLAMNRAGEVKEVHLGAFKEL